MFKVTVRWRDDSVEYGRQYRQLTKEKRFLYNKQRWEKQKQDEEFIKKERQRQREYYKNNPDKQTVRHRKYYASNTIKINSKNKKYYKEHKAEKLAHVRKRQANILKAVPKWADLEKIAEIYKQREKISRETGISHHVDHIIPLKGKNVCGLHVEYNLQIISAEQNLRKSTKIVE